MMAKRRKKQRQEDELGISRTVREPRLEMSYQPEESLPESESELEQPEEDLEYDEQLKAEAANDSRHMSTAKLLLLVQQLKVRIVLLREQQDRHRMELAATSKMLKIAEATHAGLSAIINSRG